MRVHFDFETYSEADIKKLGAWAYSRHESTQVLCLAYNFNDQDTKLWLPGDKIPNFLSEENHRHLQYFAWNSFFEYCIIKNVLKITPPPLDRWYDPSSMAAAMSLPKSLDKCGQALNLEADKAKDKRGKYLIQRLCKPYRGKRVQDPLLMDELYQYCKQDVHAEKAIYEKLRPLIPKERKLWILDQKINLRGVQIDRFNVSNALELIKKETLRLNDEVVEISDGALQNVSQRQKVLDFAGEVGYPLEKFDKAYLNKIVKDPNIPDKLKRLIEIRLLTGKTSLAKYPALENIMDDEDDRARGLLLFHGASTGRWSGRLFQPQNLPRPTFNDTDTCIELFTPKDPKLIHLIYDEPLEALSSCIRGMLKASKGSRFIASDYSAIEARVLAWLAGQEDVLDVFRDHGMIYEYAASQIYKIPYTQVNKDQRFIGKVAQLALGYQGGKNAFQKMAEQYGVKIDEETAVQVVDDWRNANTNIVEFWSKTNAAALKAVRNKGTISSTGKVFFKVIKDVLYCKLPSNRFIAYIEPRIGKNKWGHDQLCFMGNNSMTNKWETQNTYGGKLVENITQAVARDVMAHAMLELESKGYPIVLTVHDEVICEVPYTHGSVEEMEQIMCDLPEWAEGLPIEADGGYEAPRYRK